MAWAIQVIGLRGGAGLQPRLGREAPAPAILLSQTAAGRAPSAGAV
jgi:hypothetical protein